MVLFAVARLQVFLQQVLHLQELLPPQAQVLLLLQELLQ